MFNFFEKKEQHPENGLHTVFFKNGKKQSEINYKDGVKNGKYTSWHKNGQKEVENTWINGVITGMVSLWHKNGQKATELTITNGKEHGKYTSWHKNGQKASEGNYINGNQDGFFTSWDKKGRIEENEYFIYGFSAFNIDHEMTEKEVLEDFKDLFNEIKIKEKKIESKLASYFSDSFKKGSKEILKVRIDELNKKLGLG